MEAHSILSFSGTPSNTNCSHRDVDKILDKPSVSTTVGTNTRLTLSNRADIISLVQKPDSYPCKTWTRRAKHVVSSEPHATTSPVIESKAQLASIWKFCQWHASKSLTKMPASGLWPWSCSTYRVLYELVITWAVFHTPSTARARNKHRTAIYCMHIMLSLSSECRPHFPEHS